MQRAFVSVRYILNAPQKDCFLKAKNKSKIEENKYGFFINC